MQSKLQVAWASSQQRIRSRIFKETVYFRSKYRCTDVSGNQRVRADAKGEGRRILLLSVADN